MYGVTGGYSQQALQGEAMGRNRVSRYTAQQSATAPVTVMAPPGFVVCPAPIIPLAAALSWTWQQEVFRRAYEAARAKQMVTLPFYHRLFSNWN
jgi:hypothetical protein